MYKNIEKQKVLHMAEQVDYQDGQIISRTLVQNSKLSMTLFAFEKDEEISTHAAGGDAHRQSPTSFISLRSTGASTLESSSPRLRIAPASETRAHMPCRLLSAGRFSMRYSGRSEARRKAEKIAASRWKSIA